MLPIAYRKYAKSSTELLDEEFFRSSINPYTELKQIKRNRLLIDTIRQVDIIDSYRKKPATPLEIRYGYGLRSHYGFINENKILIDHKRYKRSLNILRNKTNKFVSKYSLVWLKNIYSNHKILLNILTFFTINIILSFYTKRHKTKVECHIMALEVCLSSWGRQIQEKEYKTREEGFIFRQKRINKIVCELCQGSVKLGSVAFAR